MKAIAIALPLLLALLLSGIVSAEEITVSNIECRPLREDSIGNVYYAVKASVTNNGPQGKNVSVHLQGLDRQGFEVEKVFMSGFVAAGQTQSFTTKKALEVDQFQAIYEWKGSAR